MGVIKLLCKPILQALVCCGGRIYKTNVPKSIYLVVAEHEDLLSEMFEDFYDIAWEKEDGDFIDNFDDVYKKETPKTNTAHSSIFMETASRKRERSFLPNKTIFKTTLQTRRETEQIIGKSKSTPCEDK